MGRPKKYATDEERLAAQRAARSRYNKKVRQLLPAAEQSTNADTLSLLLAPASRTQDNALLSTATEQSISTNLLSVPELQESRIRYNALPPALLDLNSPPPRLSDTSIPHTITPALPIEDVHHTQSVLHTQATGPLNTLSDLVHVLVDISPSIPASCSVSHQRIHSEESSDFATNNTDTLQPLLEESYHESDPPIYESGSAYIVSAPASPHIRTNNEESMLQNAHATTDFRGQSTLLAISRLAGCLASSCSCSGNTLPRGHTIDEITSALAAAVPQFNADYSSASQPLSLPKALPFYKSRLPRIDWAKVLTGEGLLPSSGRNTQAPPVLDLDYTEDVFIQRNPAACNLIHSYDVDSYIFSPASLGVFRHDVQFSFLPSFTRGQQRNQRVSFSTVNLTKDKCILLCIDDRSECYIFFEHMPYEYHNPEGRVIESQTQHLDDYTLGIWMDYVVLRAFDRVLQHTNRENYPKSFQNILATSNVKSEVLQRETNSRMDIRLSVPSTLLHALWENICALALSVPGTCLPVDAFSNPSLVVSAHNTKLTQLGWNHKEFSLLRKSFLEDYSSRWNDEYISPFAFWLDVGQKIRSTQPGTTLIRKTCCNTAWADLWAFPEGTKQQAKSVHFPWAGTTGGAVTVELNPSNPLRQAGVAYNKAYNVVKEQFYTPLKGHGPFDNEMFEVFAYSKPHLESWATGQKIGGLPSSFRKEDIIRQWEKTKQRIYTVLSDLREDDSVYSDRQEFRITLQLFLQIPEDEIGLARIQREDNVNHRPFWILPSNSVNQFRLAECNRWVACMEYIMCTSAYNTEKKRYNSVQEQEINTLLSTSLARTLRLSLGCPNPYTLPSIWLGKRWSRGRNFHKSTSRISRTLQPRQGLEYKYSIQQSGMIWMPKRLLNWSPLIPTFRINKYAHLDIQYNVLRRTHQQFVLSTTKTREGRQQDLLMRFITVSAHRAAKVHQARYTALSAKNGSTNTTTRSEIHMSFNDMHWQAAYAVAAQLVIREYNRWVIKTVKKRWCQQEGLKSPDKLSNTLLFASTLQLSDAASDGTEVLCYKKIIRYLRRCGVGQIQDARQKESGSTFSEWDNGTWEGRLRPLFDPASNSPRWLARLPHIAKLQEIESMFRSAVPANRADACCKTFKRVLCDQASVYIQAILHYSRDSAVTLAAKRRDRNHVPERHAQSGLQRLKWMFPRLRTSDIAVWEKSVVASHGSEGEKVDKETVHAITRRWRTFTFRDTEPLSTSRALVRDASLVGTWPASTLTKAQWFLDLFGTSEADRELQGESASEDSPWPDKESGARRHYAELVSTSTENSDEE